MKLLKLSMMICVLALCQFTQLNAKAPLGKCVNPNGEKVDWYFLYFLSNKHDSFVYADNIDTEFKAYPTTVDNFPPLDIVRYMNLKTSSWAVWNDAKIREAEDNFSTQAHSKGMLSFDNKEGIYMIHSLPNFPFIKKDNEDFFEGFPDNAGVYTQTFSCVTLSHESLIPILQNLKIMRPGIQASFLHKRLAKLEITEHFLSLIELPRTKKVAVTLNLTTVGGTNLSFFIKPNVESIPLPWDYAIPHTLESDLIVATWTKPKLLDSVCSNDYTTTNALNFEILGMEYDNNQDHSKWAVTRDPKAICTGDLNRTESQLSRSGSCLCIYSADVSRQAKKFIKRSTRCANLKFLWIELDN